MDPTVFSGLALLYDDLEPRPADIVVEAGRVIAVEERSRSPDRWLSPLFFNAHTHLGDTIAMDIRTGGDLTALVAPPDGLKHRLLREAAPDACRAGIRASAERMIRGGTAGFADFREGGEQGVALMRGAVAGLPCRCVVLGREGGESVGEGAGIPSTRDLETAQKVADEMRRQGKRVAVHAGERDPYDLDDAIALQPDLIIHATHATDAQLRACADAGIPIAVCPRSNWILGVTATPSHPPLRRMIELGCSVLLGTDNAMFVAPDMGAELAFASAVYGIGPRNLLRAAIDGAGVFGEPFTIRARARAAFMVIEPARAGLSFSRDPVTTIVRRLDPTAIATNVFNS